MLHVLHIHPESVCAAVQGISVRVERRSRGVVFDFVIRGDISKLHVPLPSPARFVDELWRHTCCEAFLAEAHGSAYYELNFSPSSEWATYRFGAYRFGMTTVNSIVPSIEVHARDDELQLQASIELWGTELESKSLRIGLTAVVEERIGRRSYWALTHGSGKPDFHNIESFMIEFPAS